MKQLSFSHRVSPDVSAGQCLKFCDDKPSAATFPNLFQQDGAPAHVHTTLLLTCAQMCRNSLNRKTGRQTARILFRLIMQFGGHCSRWCIVAKFQTLTSYQLKRVLIDCWAQLSHDTLNRASDQLPKRLMMVIKAKSAHVEFRLDWLCGKMTVVSLYVSVNWVKSTCSGHI